MSIDRKSILAKIKALLSKTVENGCTEGEAMVALDKARQMMDAYDVSDSDLAFDGEEVVKQAAERRRDRDDIRWNLCGSVGAFCDCKVWGHHGDQIIFLGLESDVLFATWLLDTLELFVKRASLSFLAEMGKARAGVTDLFGAPLNGQEREHKRRSFVYGCNARIAQRLREAAAERKRSAAAYSSDGRSLVVVKNALVEDAFKALDLKLRKGRSSGRSVDGDAFARGKAHGDRASFGRPVRGSSNGSTIQIGKG